MLGSCPRGESCSAPLDKQFLHSVIRGSWSSSSGQVPASSSCCEAAAMSPVSY